jgi:hypothetical protein
MAKAFEAGDKVKWRWGNGWGQGVVQEKFTDDVSCTIKGTDVKRQASSDVPAYRIKQDDGDEVLKSHSELERND